MMSMRTKLMALAGAVTTRLKPFALVAAAVPVVVFARPAFAQKQDAARQADSTAVVRHAFGCTLQSRQAVDTFIRPYIITPIAAVDCGHSQTFETFRLVLIRNGTALPNGVFFRGLRCVGQICYLRGREEFYASVAPNRNYRWDRQSAYRSKLTVKVRHNGTVTTVTVLSRAIGTHPKPQPTSPGSSTNGF